MNGERDVILFSWIIYNFVELQQSRLLVCLSLRVQLIVMDF
jgi:hypothetical protein